MGNIIDMYNKKVIGTKSEVMIVCENYFCKDYILIPRAEDYEDDILRLHVNSGGVLTIDYSNVYLTQILVEGILKIPIYNDTLYFEIIPCQSRDKAFNKLIPVFMGGVSKKLNHLLTKEVPNELIAVCLKQAYVDGKVVSSSQA